ncbi:MAG TPA: VTT domain-containing protein [Vicinamibacterales bacterium]|nr:VTT domain-containing protein [Vicinamibacterales bacterium]
MRIRHAGAVLAFGLAIGAAVWSYVTGGTVRVLVDGAGSFGDSSQTLDALRAALDRWGRLAPAVYVAAVVIEVLVAPIPGTLLYAPAGALFGGFMGGTLSLIGNTLGAAIACGVGSALGESALVRRIEGTKLAAYRTAIQQRGLWVVLLLRINPLTSSDLVSYMAGAVGVPIWRVALGTFIGMAPLCFAQSYLAEQIFEILPGAVYVLVAAGIIYVLALVIWLTRGK